MISKIEHEKKVLEANLELEFDSLRRKLDDIVDFIKEAELQNTQTVLDFFDYLNETSTKF